MAETPLTPEQRDLAARYVPYARSIARKFKKRYACRLAQEIESAAMLALVTSAQRFDPSLGYSFPTSAYLRIHGACTSAIRDDYQRRSREKRETQDIFLEEIPDKSSLDYEKDNLKSIDIDRLSRGLDQRSKDALHLWSCGLTMIQIGREIRCSRSRTVFIINHAIEFLRLKAGVDPNLTVKRPHNGRN